MYRRFHDHRDTLINGRWLFLLALLVLAACSSAEPDVETMATVSEDASASSDNLDIEYGRNENGTFYQGAAGAPVTIIDYSDFL